MPEPVRWVIPAILVVSAAGALLAVWWERVRPSPCPCWPDVLAAWRSLPTETQAAHDQAALDAAETADRTGPEFRG